MVKVRQDAWSHEDDLLLAETVLRHIREGSTQLNAFEEVGDKLNRTSAACGFRWNAEVRQRYDQAVAIAKRQRKEKKRAQARQQKAKTEQSPTPATTATTDVNMLNHFDQTEPEEKTYQPTVTNTNNQNFGIEENLSSINLDIVIDYLHTVKKEYQQSSHSHDSLVRVQSENEQLRQEKEALEKKNSQLQEQLNTIQEDYQVLIQIMDRARKMVVFDDEDSVSTPAFRMEKNGNLEQVAR